MSKINKQTDKYYTINNLIKINKNKLYELNKLVKKKEIELKTYKQELEQNCNHLFVKECTTSGCYAEYHNICQYCNKWY